MSEGAALNGRIGPQLLACLPASSDHGWSGAAETTARSTIRDLAQLLLDEGDWDESFGTLLPGLLLETSEMVPFSRLNTRARNALRILRVTTWGDLAHVRPDQIMRLRNVGVQTLAEIAELAVDRALSAPRTPLDGSLTPESGAGPPAKADGEPHEPRPTSRVTSPLEKLASWAERETEIGTVGELLAALTRDHDIPPDVEKTWAAIAGTRVSAIARHPAGGDSLGELFDRLLSILEDRQRSIFIARCLTTEAATLQELAEQLGITRERVRQLQGKAKDRVASLLDEERFAPLGWRAHSLSSALGASIPTTSEVFLTALGDATADCAPERRPLLGRLLLSLAGFVERDGWIIRGDAGTVTARELEESADEYGLIDADLLDELLSAAGVAREDHPALLKRIGGFRQFGDRFAIWRGSVVDKAVRVLAVLARPATPEELAETIGEGHSIRSLRNRLYGDARLMRVSKNQWALRAWEMEEYTGVADEIAEEIERQGGSASLSHLIKVLTSQFGIAEGSVRAYSQTPRFVLEDGMVRLRREDEEYEVSASLADAKGCFQDSPTSVTFCVTVDEEVLRGSGRPLPTAVAAFLNLAPGNECRFRAESADGGDAASIVLSWPIDSAVGPTLGSIRLLAVEARAEEGDLLKLRFDRAAGTIQATRVAAAELQEAPALQRLSRLTGLQLDSSNAVEQLAEALGVDRESVRRVLHARGDSHLVSLLPQPAVDADLNAALAELGDTLLRPE